jgi:hypothetical protein
MGAKTGKTKKSPRSADPELFEEKCHVDMTDSIFANTGITLSLTSAYP